MSLNPLSYWKIYAAVSSEYMERIFWLEEQVANKYLLNFSCYFIASNFTQVALYEILSY